MSNLQMIEALESITNLQSKIISMMATRLAELGDIVTGRDELAEVDKIYQETFGGSLDL